MTDLLTIEYEGAIPDGDALLGAAWAVLAATGGRIRRVGIRRSVPVKGRPSAA